ncbi:hypothetical protein FKW77_003632 [Venturia effusa]|uniref:Uncharacterized protein n=1 Tax=Venturia effusa TaxID=50376 RepID=A0A517KW24_9PEZI|nr:hypothetical protein FKW77_003632 [Venturia effusa]
MQFKQVLLALCLSGFAVARSHHRENGTAVTGADAAGTGTGTAVAAVGTGTAGRKKHGGAAAASNGTTSSVRTRTAGFEEDNGVSRANNNGTRDTSEKSQCREIERLTRLSTIINNATALSELEAKHNLTAAQIDDFKAKAANATTRLTELQANSTLTAQCSVVNAGSKLVDQCKEITRLSKMAALATNTSALSDLQTKKNLTDAEMAKIKDRAQNATVKLTELQGNTTLIAACQTIKTTGGDKRNETGRANAASGEKLVRSMSDAGQVLGNAVFAVVMGGVAVLLMV